MSARAPLAILHLRVLLISLRKKILFVDFGIWRRIRSLLTRRSITSSLICCRLARIIVVLTLHLLLHLLRILLRRLQVLGLLLYLIQRMVLHRLPVLDLLLYLIQHMVLLLARRRLLETK